ERTVQEGRPGEITIIEEVTYTDGVETNREEISREVTVEALPTIIEVGTGVVVVEYQKERYSISPPATTRTANPDMYEGDERTVVEPADGISEETFKVTYKDGVEISRESQGTEIIAQPVQGKIEYGTMPLPDHVEVTAPMPVRKGNILTIPNALGVEYVNLANEGTETDS